MRGNKVVGLVHHEQAFGLIGDLDLRSCDLPEYPTAKYVKKPIANPYFYSKLYHKTMSIAITTAIIKGYTL